MASASARSARNLVALVMARARASPLDREHLLRLQHLLHLQLLSLLP